MGRLFGTDGIRGVANQHPITCEIALKTGRAVGLFCKKKGYSCIVIGKDTRISGDMLESALSAGVNSVGIDVCIAGIIPTPGVAFLCQTIPGAGAGIVISASHNPYTDNGIKIFKAGGIKLSDEQEAEIEDYILDNQNVPRGEVGTISIISDSLQQYANFLLCRFPIKKPLKKLKLIIDCSNGAASKIGRLVFCDPLFTPFFIHNHPDGKNINADCGSQHTKDLQKAVVEKKADLGLAFDGDADRLIVIDETGQKVTGDCILAICAVFAHQASRLKNNTLVSTIMSNIGLTKALESQNITHIKADVGDRKVLEEMKRTGAVIGGEDSGHMIFLDDHSTGDGLLSALKLIEVMLTENKSMSVLAKIMTVFPQILMNVDVDPSRPDFMAVESIVDTIKSVEKKLGGQGRVLVRYSGTQPMIRVMVEGPDQDQIENFCRSICNSIESAL